MAEHSGMRAGQRAGRWPNHRWLGGLLCALLVLTAAPPAIDAASTTNIEGLRTTRVEARLVVLNWQKVSGADSYNIYLDDQPPISDGDTWSTIRNLDPVVTYSVSVAAIVDGVEGPPSAPVTFTTSDVRLRDPFLVVDTGTFKLSSSSVPFAWAMAPFTRVELFRDGTQLNAADIDFSGRLIDSDVVPGRTYTYKARLVSNATGLAGPFGPDVVVTVPGAPGAPTIAATFADNSVTVLRMSNIEGSARSFEVERDGTSLGVFGRRLLGSNEWFSDQSIGQFALRSYRVRMIDRNGTAGPWSNVAQTTEFTNATL